MTDRTVPAGTVIESEARTVDPRRLESLWLPPGRDDEDDHHLSFQGEYAVSPAVASLARSWVAGLPEGWCQVEAVIAALRSGYIHDRSATSRRAATDVVAEFLLARPPRPRLPVRLRGGRAPPVAGVPDPSRQRSVRGAGAIRPPDTAHAGDSRRRPLLGRGPAAGWALGRRRTDSRLRADATGSLLVRADRPGGRGRRQVGPEPRRRPAGRDGSSSAVLSSQRRRHRLTGWRRWHSGSVPDRDPRRRVLQAP